MEKKLNKIKNFKKELFEFLRQYSVIGLAIGVITAQVAKDLIDSIVKGFFMPLVNLIVPSGKFQNMIFYIQGVKFDIGQILNALLTFFIVMLILYIIVKKIIRQDDLLEKK